MSEAVVVHVFHLVDNSWGVCLSDGSFRYFCKARGKRAAVGKWEAHFGLEATKMITYQGRCSPSIMAVTMASLVEEADG